MLLQIKMKKILFLLLIPFVVFSQKVPLQHGNSGNAVKVTKGTCVGCIPIVNIVTNPATGNTNGIFTYTIPSTGKRSSAGVYDASSNLVRTLWADRPETGGATISAQWDGLDDNGNAVPPGNYTAKTRTNGITAVVDGFIGNTSSDQTGGTTFRSYGGNTCFAFVGTKGFFGQFFYEGGTNSKSFNTTDITQNYDVAFGVHASTLECATDGTNIYWVGQDQYYPPTNHTQKNFIYACKASDNTAVAFSPANETSVQNGREREIYSHFIGYAVEPDSIRYTGIAVNANFIFATKQASNKLTIFNKATGALLQNLTYAQPGKLAAGSNNELWMIVNSVLKKFTVNPSTGALTDANLSVAATNPINVRISPDNGTLLILDLGTQQVKAYSNSTGALQWVLGQPGGYDVNGPAVSMDKFMFNRADFAIASLAYQADGSFWVGDIGNYRTLHFKADRTYKEQIMYLPSFRNVNIDQNNPTRIFADELEFQRDYSKPLDNGVNGSWKLVKNWKVGTGLDIFRKFTQVVTLSNGHTYASGDNVLYDLTANGAVQVSNNFDGNQLRIEADGSLYTQVNHANVYLTVTKQALTGFGSNNMPQWGPSTTVATTPNFTTTSPYSFNSFNNVRGASTNTGRYFFFNPNGNSQLSYILNGALTGIGNHLAAIKTNGNSWDWQASKSTFSRLQPGGVDYHGDYPRNGDFDIGNNDSDPHKSENAQLLVNGSYLLWQVNAEFWKANTPNGEVNIFNLFYEDGLPLLNFGKTGTEAFVGNSIGFTGNGYATAWYKSGNVIYVYQCDESQHGAITCWKISGLETVSEQTTTLVVTQTPFSQVNDPTDLMKGLPYRSTTFTGGNGWTVPAGLNLKTNTLQYQKGNTDIALGGDGDKIITKSLDNTASLSNWVLSASVSYQNGELSFGNAPDGSNNYNDLDILDVSDKIIAHFIGNQGDTQNDFYRRVWFNNSLVFQSANQIQPNDLFFRDISFTYANGTLTFKHQDYAAVTVTTPFQAGADMTKPATLRYSQGGNRTRYINLYKLRFTPNSTQTIAP